MKKSLYIGGTLLLLICILMSVSCASKQAVPTQNYRGYPVITTTATTTMTMPDPHPKTVPANIGKSSLSDRVSCPSRYCLGVRLSSELCGLQSL